MTERKPYNKYVPIPEGEKLKPCPFCGMAYPTIFEEYDRVYKIPYYEVHCPGCGARSHSIDSPLSAVYKWNTRVKQ